MSVQEENAKRINRIIFATGNRDKLKEIRVITEPLGFSVVAMKDAGFDFEIEENGTTFAENALIKARTVCRASGEITMADDSGLVVDAMGGMPGIYSARYMGHDTPYSIKNAAIIREAMKVPEEERTARYICAIACVFPDGRELLSEAAFEGRIAEEPRGENGFGYDPIFYVPEAGKTAAEMLPEEKHAISHRGKALREMEEKLRAELGMRE